MKSCGIVVEYNPFHNGHKYHAEMARELSGSEVVIAVMSGNFLQRGEPAIIDKWARSEVALQNGVDLVIELPTVWSLQAADYFAKGAVEILQSIGCQALCFGTDGTADFDYQKFGKFVAENQNLVDETFQSLHDQKLSYPQKMNQVFRKIYPEIQLDGTTPNHILGLTYAQENAKYLRPMQLFPLKRQGAGYHDENLSTGRIASATAIREAIFNKQSVRDFLPVEMFGKLQKAVVAWEDYWPYLRFKILTSTLSELQQIYQMTDGLENRMQEMAGKADSFADFVARVKSKRYTWTRLQRLCCYLLLNITTVEIRQAWRHNYLHLLGFNQKGQEFLKLNKKAFTLPLISKVGQAEKMAYPLALRADYVYQMGNSAIPEQNFGRQPIRL